MKFFRSTDKIMLTLKLPDQDGTRYPVAKVYNNNGALAGTYDLTHIENGYYLNALAAATLAVGSYSVYYLIYDDAGKTKLTNKYEDSEESFKVDDQLQKMDTAISKIDTAISEVDNLDGQVS